MQSILKTLKPTAVQYFLLKYLRLIKSGKKMDAVKHARKHLSSNDPEQLPLIQRGMGLLAFPADTNVEPYRYS